MKKSLAIILLGIGIILTVYYGARAAKTYLILRNLEHNIENPVPLQRWMTIPYLSKTYNIPKEYLYDAINVPAEDNDKRSLRNLRVNYFEGDLEAIFISVQQAIADYEQEKP